MARAAEQLRWLAPLVCLCALPSRAQAQEPRPNTPAQETATTHSAADAPRHERAPTVLFLLPTDANEGQALRDALLAQFALLDAQLVFEAESPDSKGSLSSHLSLAQDLAARRDAVAVFWIDAPADGHWLLHMMDAQNERVIVRPVNAGGERRSAAIEAVAVMTRSSTRALMEDQPERAASVTSEDGTPTAPAVDAAGSKAAAPATSGAQPNSESGPSGEAAPARHSDQDWLRLWIGYTGDHFAREVDWQHGIAFGVSYLGFVPWYGGVTFALTPAIDISSPSIAFSLRRLPMAARFGYRFVQDRISLDAEVGFLLEWLHRSPAEKRVPNVTTGKDPTDGLLAALAPRVRAELRVLPAVGLYAGGGLDILLNDFAYVSDEPERLLLLQPNRFRPVAELGISFYP
jgi:hypothetical protein